MQFFFVDDSSQKEPTRKGMGPLVALGGICISCERVRGIEAALHNAALKAGIPEGEKFKWSPGRELWMRTNLVGEDRQAFYTEIIQLAQEADVKAFVMVADVNKAHANSSAEDAQQDVALLLMERMDTWLKSKSDDGVIVVDRPPGSRKDEDRYLADCLSKLRAGTKYVKPDRIAINYLSANSAHVRLLQLADVVVGCTLARVSGEGQHCNRSFDLLKPLFARDGARAHGIGLKLHPDLRYCNLYHWLLGETHYRRGNTGYLLPDMNRPYALAEDAEYNLKIARKYESVADDDIPPA